MSFLVINSHVKLRPLTFMYCKGLLVLNAVIFKISIFVVNIGNKKPNLLGNKYIVRLLPYDRPIATTLFVDTCQVFNSIIHGL